MKATGRNFGAARQLSRVKRETLSVAGMACDGCERNVESALGDLDGVTRVKADHEDGTLEVVVDDEVPDEDVRAAIEDAGYDVAV